MTFKRLYELSDINRNSPEAHSFDAKHEPIAEKCFRDIETELQGLDSVSWDCLKSEAAPLARKKDPSRGWAPLFDKLNEAKGYNYLARIGCSNVRLIPRSSLPGQKTPDSEGCLGDNKVLCEIKTINISKAEWEHRNDGTARTIQTHLPKQFFDKLKSSLETARDQMIAYCPSAGTRKIAYVVVNYDDILHEYEPNYAVQINDFIASNPVPDLEIIVDAKPRFYFATA